MTCQNNFDIHTQEENDSSDTLTQLMPLLYTLGFSSIVASVFYIIMQFFREQIQKQFFSSVNIDNNDPMFDILQNYLSEVGLLSSKLSNLHANLEKAVNQPWWKEDQGINMDDFKPSIKYTPSSGNHKFTYKGKSIFVQHTVGNTITVGWERTPQKQESITIWCFGKGKIGFLKEILNEAYSKAQQKDHGKTNIYALHEWYCGWDKAQSKEPRSFDSVILDDNLADTIVKDLSNFLKSQKWYNDTGVPYKRGYLLYGPPGTGKTSFILAIAGRLGLNICTVNLSGNRLNDDSLNRLLESTPKRSIVLLEDIDAIFVDRESVQKQQEKGGDKVSFSGLLNALDGVRSQEGRILFMTTNHREKLDPALMRPGRADVHVKLNYASENQAKRLFLKFYPDQEKLAEKFCKLIPENKVSMAKLQGLFLKYKTNPQDVFDNVSEVLETEVENHFNMTVIDFLIRLNIPQYAHKFIKEKITRIYDMQAVEEGNLEDKFDIKCVGLKKRVMGIIQNEENYMKQFRLMSLNSVRSFIMSLLKSDFTQSQLNEIIELIPDNLVTEFQLRDIIDATGQYEFETLKKNIQQLVQIIQQFNKAPVLKKQFETEQAYMKIKDNLNPEQILKDLKMEKFLEKFKEENLLEKDLFLEIEDGDLENVEIKQNGVKKLFLKKLKTLKEDQEKLKVEQNKYLHQKVLEYNNQHIHIK